MRTGGEGDVHWLWDGPWIVGCALVVPNNEIDGREDMD